MAKLPKTDMSASRDDDFTNPVVAGYRDTDVFTDDPSLIGAASGNEPEVTVAGVYSDGSKPLPATGVGAGITGMYNNNGVVKNVAICKNAGPAGTWNFVSGANVPLDTDATPQFGNNVKGPMRTG